MSGKYSYGLSKELMSVLESEFPVAQPLQEFRTASGPPDRGSAENSAPGIFGEFGSRLADRLVELEGRYRDRSAEVALMIAKQTGHPFPSLQQRLLEIGILAVLNENRWRYLEISHKRLAYEVTRCVVHEALKMNPGPDIAGAVPCRHFCLGFFEGVCRKSGPSEGVSVHMPSRISDDAGRCTFEARYRPQ